MSLVHTLESDTLEFRKSLGVYERFLRTPLSPPLLFGSTPTDNLDWLTTRFEEIRESRLFLESGRKFPFDGIGDVNPILAKCAMPGSLCEGSELARVLETLRGIRQLRKALAHMDRPLGALTPYLHRIQPPEDFEQRLAGSLESDGSLKDTASANLARLRDRIRRQRAHIQRRLEDLCRNPDVRPLLQDDYFTERNGRYVLPVQANYKRRLQGLQHGKSVTGTTAFIEPIELVEPGNLLSEAIEEEIEEVLIILRGLTDALRSHLPTLLPTIEAVAELDLVVSLAEYSLFIQGEVPSIVEEGGLDLREIRHPLLLAQMSREKVVPNDLTLEPDCSGLLITGPNTGGKTVVMKTAGLACLLALSGLPIPCGKGTVIPLLGGALADIGDDQSIEQSLSTFSAHAARIKRFHEFVRDNQRRGGHRPLVIIDELGAGTDPAEGAALGRALLEELIRMGAWLLVATHLGELKLYGFNHPSLKSGAMLFNEETLSPTYQLRLDSVGESHGLAIAQKLGLAPSIISRAEELMIDNPNQAISLLHRLSEEEKKAREMRADIEREKALAEKARLEILKKLDETSKEEKRILDEARSAAERKVLAAKRRMATIEERIRREEEKLLRGMEGREEGLVQREKQICFMEQEIDRRMQLLADLLKRFPNYSSDILRSNDFARLAKLAEPEWKKILEQINTETAVLQEEFPRQARAVQLDQEMRPRWEQIAAGDSLRLDGIANTVLVLDKDERKKKIAVSLGNLRMEVPYSRVLQRFPKSARQEPAAQVKISNLFKTYVPPEINLIGMTVDEMEGTLLKYIDEAALSGHPSVRIIHGYGAGILKKAVQRILKDCPLVSKFHDAEPFEGGSGATIIQFKG